MKKKGRIALICAVAAVPLLLIAAFLLVALPYINAACSMPEGAALHFVRLTETGYSLSWDAAENAARYGVAVDGETVGGGLCGENRALLADLDEGNHTVTVTPYGVYSILGAEHLREGEPLTVDVSLRSPDAPQVGWLADADTQTLTAAVQPLVGTTYELRLVGPGEVVGLDDEQVLASGTGGELTVRFGGEGGLQVPEYGEAYRFVARATVGGEGYTVTGLPSRTYLLEREDMLPDTSELTVGSAGENRYTLTWTEAKGGKYEVQRLDGGEWVTLGSVACTDELKYETGTLASCRSYTFRVVGLDSGVAEPVSVSGEQSVMTERSALYCTIWPLTQLDVYADSAMAEATGDTVPAATAYCVLAEENGMFRVRVGDGVYGWIDSRYCLINLPEYLGEMLAYDITNSYASKYLVHGYNIPEVSGTVIPGYEHVRLAEGKYLVPYLYPCCDKLYNAAEAALADGYRLKIYDSYRPRMATRYIFDTTEAIIDEPLPETDFYGEMPEDLPDEEDITYRRLVTEGSYSLPNFLAQNGSMHNLGIALDLTLELFDSGEELEMQTDMHDLSVYSVISRNNANAVLLDGYMKAAGFGGLTSEWWHFQDNETRDALGLNIYMQYGVSLAGWHADDNGWRYLYADGSAAKGVVTIDGAVYSFNGHGYLEPAA